jgi:hypothetical protein
MADNQGDIIQAVSEARNGSIQVYKTTPTKNNFGTVHNLCISYKDEGVIMSVTIPPVVHSEFRDKREPHTPNHYRAIKSNAAFTVMFSILQVQLFMEGKLTVLDKHKLLLRKRGSVALALPAPIPPWIPAEEWYVAKRTHFLFDQVENLLGTEPIDVKTFEEDFDHKLLIDKMDEVYASCRPKHYRYPGYSFNDKPTLLDFEAAWAVQESKNEDTCQVRCIGKDRRPGLRDCVGVRRLYLVNELIEIFGPEFEEKENLGTVTLKEIR